VSRNSDDNSHSESAASCIQRSFRRRSLLARSNRSLLEGGDASHSSLGGAAAVAVGVGATTVVALGAEAVAGNRVSFTPSTDLNEVGTESMENDVEANNWPTDASDNDEMGLEYLMADSLGDNTDSNGSHSSPEDEEENEYKQVGWVGAKGILSHAGYTMLGRVAAVGRKLMFGGGDPVDEDDAFAAASQLTGRPGVNIGGPAGGPPVPPPPITVVP
jgi:hypothetical protein